MLKLVTPKMLAPVLIAWRADRKEKAKQYGSYGKYIMRLSAKLGD